VSFQINDICKKNNDNAIRQVLKNLLRGLNETYARILHKVRDQHQSAAIKGFKWLSASKHPLTLTEICEAIAIKSTDTYFGQIESRHPNDSLKLVQNCGALVIVNKQDQIVQFIHSTVLEFLRSSWAEINYPSYYINVFKANLELGERCITYLSLADFETQIATINPTPREAPTFLEAQATTLASAIATPGSLLAGLARFALARQSFSSRPNIPQPSNIFKKREGPTPSEPWEIMSQKYTLLNYIRLNWLHHCTSLLTQDERTWMLFENLVYKKTLPFQHLPWVGDEGPEDLPALPFFQWAIENDHVALLSSLICQLGSTHIRQYFDYPIRSRDTAIHVACSFGNNRIVEVLLENDVKLLRTESSEQRYRLQPERVM